MEESRRSVTVSGESGATAGNEVYVNEKVLLKLSVFILTVALTGTPVLAASLSDFSERRFSLGVGGTGQSRQATEF